MYRFLAPNIVPGSWKRLAHALHFLVRFSGVSWWRRARLGGSRHLVRIGQLGAVAKGILSLEQFLCRKTVLFDLGDVQITVALGGALLCTLLNGRYLVETVIGELVGVVFHFGLIESLTTEVEEVEDAEDDQEDQDSAREIH